MGAPWVPARTKDIELLLDKLELKKGTRLVELGCGDGRLLVVAAKKGLACTGYEINPLLFFISLVRTARYRKLAKVKLVSFWRQDLFGADIVITFLVPKTMGRLEARLNKEFHGGWFASYIFILPTKKPQKKVGRWQLYKF